jgi:hypothetical protein
MKKMKSILCGMLLTTCMASNVFAGDFSGYGVLSFFNRAINTIVSMLTSSDPCEGRICTNCKPGSGGEENGNCRPPEK